MSNMYRRTKLTMDWPAGPDLSDDSGLDLWRLGASLRDVFQGSVVHFFNS